MADLLTVTRDELAKRRDHLAPMVSEHDRIVEALARLDALPGTAAASENGHAPRRRGPGRPRAARPRSRGAGRKKGSGKRASEALKIIGDAGDTGITLQGVAKKLGIQPNYLYRVLPGIEKEGRIEKLGSGHYVLVPSFQERG